MTRIVVVGGDAAGATTAAQVKRRQPDWDVVMVDRGRYTSYSACGLPYWVAGDVESDARLIARTPEQHRAHGLDVRMGTEAVGLNLAAQTVALSSVEDGDYDLGFDHLMIATGASPVTPPIPGVDAPNVGVVHTIDGTRALLQRTTALADGDPPKSAVIVGAGFIGIEMAEAFEQRGLAVTLIDMAEAPLTSLDPELSAELAKCLSAREVECAFGQPVQAIEVGTDGLACAVTTDADSYPADIVVLALGVRPNTSLATAAGLPAGAAGGLLTDRAQHVTGHGNIWAAGDCTEAFHRLLRRPVFLPLGTHANKQGRVAGVNIAGGYATFPGVIGTATTRFGETYVARTGLNEDEAASAGLRVESATTTTAVTTGYMPGAVAMMVKLLADAASGQLLGGQILGASPLAAKRIDSVALAVWNAMTAEDLLGADLSYSPPVSPVWDPVQTAARVLASRLER
ncbi:MAG: flavoprotein oxidoreductase [Actinobacteria bacterium]|nr:MAG: flavoprotein oxidoreductase [Actinomycetota bacterium]